MTEKGRSRTTPVLRDVPVVSQPDWPRCAQCRAPARWTIASAEDGDLNSPAISGFACRRHLSYVLEYHPDAMAGMDQAVVIDLMQGEL